MTARQTITFQLTHENKSSFDSDRHIGSQLLSKTFDIFIYSQYDERSLNIRILFSSHQKSIHNIPIVCPLITPQNGHLISKGFGNLWTGIITVK